VRGFTQNSVASLLFPAEVHATARGSDHARGAHAAADGMHAVVAEGEAGPSHGPSASHGPPSDGTLRVGGRDAPHVLDAASVRKPSGRAQAVRIADYLAKEVGVNTTPGLPPALSPRAAAALATKPTSGPQAAVAGSVGESGWPGAALLARHEDVLALTAADVVPHLPALDRAASEVIQQLGTTCAEQAILIEYLRRHQLAAAGAARALLGRLQLTVRMYDELRALMDRSLLQASQHRSHQQDNRTRH